MDFSYIFHYFYISNLIQLIPRTITKVRHLAHSILHQLIMSIGIYKRLFDCLIPTIFHLHYHCATFQCMHRMPLPSRNVQRHHRSVWRQFYRFNTTLIQFIIKLFHQSSTQTHNRFRSLLMSMNRHHGSWLNSIQHSL